MAKRQFLLGGLFTILHFALVIFLYDNITVSAPDFDFVSTYPGLRFIDERSQFMPFIFVAPSLLIPNIWNQGEFYAGPVWWGLSLLVSAFFGSLVALILDQFSRYFRQRKKS